MSVYGFMFGAVATTIVCLPAFDYYRGWVHQSFINNDVCCLLFGWLIDYKVLVENSIVGILSLGGGLAGYVISKKLGI